MWQTLQNNFLVVSMCLFSTLAAINPDSGPNSDVWALLYWLLTFPVLGFSQPFVLGTIRHTYNVHALSLLHSQIITASFRVLQDFTICYRNFIPSDLQPNNIWNLNAEFEKIDATFKETIQKS